MQQHTQSRIRRTCSCAKKWAEDGHCFDLTLQGENCFSQPRTIKKRWGPEGEEFTKPIRTMHWNYDYVDFNLVSVSLKNYDKTYFTGVYIQRHGVDANAFIHAIYKANQRRSCRKFERWYHSTMVFALTNAPLVKGTRYKVEWEIRSPHCRKCLIQRRVYVVK